MVYLHEIILLTLFWLHVQRCSSNIIHYHFGALPTPWHNYVGEIWDVPKPIVLPKAPLTLVKLIIPLWSARSSWNYFQGISEQQQQHRQNNFPVLAPWKIHIWRSFTTHVQDVSAAIQDQRHSKMMGSWFHSFRIKKRSQNAKKKSREFHPTGPFPFW